MQNCSFSLLDWTVTKENEEEINVNPLLPLHGYHECLNKIISSALPLHALDTDTVQLPGHIIAKIQTKCSHKDLLALTSINSAAFITRFYNPCLQSLCFKDKNEIKSFLSYWKIETHESENSQRSNKRLKTSVQDAATLHHITRPQENFEDIKTLSLELSDQLTAEQCIPLIKLLTGVKNLIIFVSDILSCGEGLASLTPLLQAAHYLPLHHLTIEGEEDDDDDCSPPEAKQDFLPDEFSPFKELRSLCLGNLNRIKVLPSSIETLAALERCVLDRLINLEKLPKFFGQLKALRKLELYDLHSLQYLPDSIGELNNLEACLLIRLTKIEKLPETFGQLKALRWLECNLESLQYIPNSMGNLDGLETLSLISSALINIPIAISQFKALKSLTLDGLNFLPEGIEKLVKLEHLRLSDLAIETLPTEIGRLCALKSLIITDMDSLTTLPDNIGDLGKLEILTLSELAIEMLPAAIGQLPELRSLNLEYLDDLISLPTELRNLNKLEKFSVKELDNLQEEARALISEITARIGLFISLPHSH